ncbi:putative wall-associated receptor kinase-like 16 [Triticum urartu]|nr:putative wall-associated receptor kinase-like 16 [Triticum urartu]
MNLHWEENQHENLSRKADQIRVPVILAWALAHDAAVYNTGHSRCPREAAQSICKSAHSDCIVGDTLQDQVRGYSCHCREGYQGNPYLTGGCQDIKECDQKEKHFCFGDCEELPGSFQCRCPNGTHGNYTKSGGCIIIESEDTIRGHNNLGLIIGLSVASGPFILLLVLGAILTTRGFKQRKANVLRQKFFTQNRGQLLKQLVSHRADIAERMLITLEELEKATNNFDQARRLGGGGHGTVYKGIMLDLHVVAIKKSNIVVRREIDEFINEVAILSQINHRNIVKLRGCCLETEVPLLAYEFISNGTLADHLHMEERGSLPWKDRLRITSEIGKALAYLHSAISVPVIHRDIKPSNILLDDALTAKVSDFGASRYIIPVDQTGSTTAVQGTIGYLDPMYYYTGRLTESSDVYSFGVLLVELLTRRKPSLYRSSEGDGLVMQFVALLAEGNLAKLIDPQVIQEGGSEVEEVATLAMECVKLRAEERPTMRQVEMALEALQAPNKRVQADLVEETDEKEYAATGYPSTSQQAKKNEGSRCYSQEDEFLLSATYPR